MTASSQHLISSFCRTCLQQLPCESSYNLFATPGLAKQLIVCTSLSVEQQDGFPDNICGVCYSRLNEMHNFLEQCVDAVQKFQDMVRLIGSNEIKAPSGFGKSYNGQQDTNGIKKEIIISNDSEDININSENSMKKIKECEQVVLGTVEKIEIDETQIIQEIFNKKGVQPQFQETEGKKYECDTCGKKFTRYQNLKCHKNIHENPYVCKTCGKGFSHRSFLRPHEMIHTGEKPYKCEICDKKFTQAMSLKHHKTIHTGEKPYVCKTCGKQFSHRNSLSSHVLTHTGEKPHECEVCDKKFTKAAHLKYHKTTHTGEKPYVCKTCGKQFSLRSNQSIHEMIHTGEKPHKCEICDKKFRQAAHLKTHKIIHTGEKPFICKTCGKQFSHRKNLSSHEMIHKRKNLTNVKFAIKSL